MAYFYIRLGKVAKLVFLLPGIILLYLSFDSDPSTSLDNHGRQSASRWLMSLYESNRNYVFKSKKRDGTKQTILLFGMKPHWKEFCKYPEMSHCKDLINFPRDVFCPTLNQSITITFSESAEDIRGADVVLFTNVYNWMTPDMWTWIHGNRSDGQPWALVSLESPLYVPGMTPPEQYRDTTYTWVASYKIDSDLTLPYGYYESYGESKPPEIDLKPFVTNKTKLIAWMSSNCGTLQWDRHRFVNDLKEIIQVDKYGKCGEQEVPWNDAKAVRATLGQYKFYLSLENSCCDDYVSEKFWRTLEMGVIPVVVGASREQYTKIAPPNSFIHVDQFASLAELAIHLTVISNDEDQYLEYFKWRNQGRIVVYSQEVQYVVPLMEKTHCSLFQHYLQTNRSEDKTVEYMGKRWFGSCDSCGDKWIQSYKL